MVAKVSLGLIGLSAISVGGVALSKPSWLGMGEDPMPLWHSLAEDNDLTAQSSNYTGKFGEKHKNYLVGTTHKKNGQTSETNKAWWEWAFRRWKGENPSKGKFKYVKPENGNGADALKNLCAEAYKKGDSEFHANVDNSENKPTKNEVWKYCSPGKLTTISEDTETNTSGQIGEESANKTVLISVKNSANDWFWKIRDEEFWGSDKNAALSGSKATNGGSGKQSSFKEEYEKNKEDGKATARQTIKKLCEEAYKLAKSGNESDNTDANRFCKLETN